MKRRIAGLLGGIVLLAIALPVAVLTVIAALALHTDLADLVYLR